MFDNSTLLLGLLVAVVVFLTLDGAMKRQRRGAWKSKNRGRWQRNRTGGTVKAGPWLANLDADQTSRPDAADQLRIVMSADFTVQPLLNKSEAPLFRELDRFVQTRNPGWQVMAQVCLGEILSSRAKAAYGCINAKRVDLLLVDGDYRPVAAIEYQGSGHHLGTAAARDAVKKEALRRAGIGYHEVVAGVTTRAELKRLVEKLVPMGASADA